MPDSLDFDDTLQKLVAGARVFDRYVLTRLVGRGKNGDVWEALDQRLDHPVALKILVNHPHYERLAASIGRIIGLTHPNIVRTFDFVGNQALCALVMELVNGQSLAQRLRENQPPFFEAAEAQPWTCDLFAALEHAWKNGRIVHGDIRPANLFITKSGLLKVAEFPFAALREGRALLTGDDGREDLTAVSLPCLSPQVAGGEPALHSDDLYAAGACLYEMLTGKPVFPGGNLQVQIQRKVPPSIAERRTELERKGTAVPKALEALAARCLAKPREERPSTAAEVVTALQNAATATSKARFKTATRALVPSAGWLAVLRHPLATLLLVLAIAAGVYYFAAYKPAQDKLQLRQARYEALSADDGTAAAEADPAAREALWQSAFNEFLLHDIPFTSADDKYTELARARLENWKGEAEKLAEKKKAEARLIADKTDELQDAIREEKKIAVPADAGIAVLTARVAAWDKLLDEHSAKDSLASEPFKQLLAIGGPQLDEFKQELDNAKAERDKTQTLLAAAQKEEARLKLVEEDKKRVALAWKKEAEPKLAAVKTLCADVAKNPGEKLDAINSLLGDLQKNVPPLAAADAAALTNEARSLHQQWSAALAALTPKTVLKLPELFANSPYSAAALTPFGPPERHAAQLIELIQEKVLAEAQAKIFAEPGIKFEGQQNAKADGKTGPTTQRAILAYQSLPDKKLIPTAQLDTATLAALGLDKLALDSTTLAEEAKQRTAQVSSKSSSSGNSGRRGASYKKKTPEDDRSDWAKLGDPFKKGYQAVSGAVTSIFTGSGKSDSKSDKKKSGSKK